jgi:hypothetical protein
MEQTVLSLPIKTSNNHAIQYPLVGTADKVASDMVRYAAEFDAERTQADRCWSQALQPCRL